MANGLFTGEVQSDGIATDGAWLVQIHLSDATAQRWDHGALGTGTIAFAKIAWLLDAQGFAGTSIVEIVSVDPDHDVAAALRQLTGSGSA